eukprot:SAG25_NODE_13673_length_264_cov_0.630303_1_plen_71_part_10
MLPSAGPGRKSTAMKESEGVVWPEKPVCAGVLCDGWVAIQAGEDINVRTWLCITLGPFEYRKRIRRGHQKS